MDASDSPVVMVACDDCGHMVPEANLAIHHATACGARARRVPPSSPSDYEAPNLGLTQRIRTTTALSSTPDNNLGARIAAIAAESTEDHVSNRKISGETPPVNENDGDTNNPTPIRTTSDQNDRERATSNQNGNENSDVVQSGDVVDLTADTPPRRTSNSDAQWTCPRCTLFNPHTAARCNVCLYENENAPVRAADPSRREQLLPNNSTSSPSVLPAGAAGGALLGGVLGAAHAYMGGRSVGTAALEGAMTGFVGGALMGDIVSNMNGPPTSVNPNQSVASARSGASMGLPTYPSLNTPPASSNNRRMRPRQSVRVVRRRNGGGTYTTTIHTSDGRTTTTRTANGGDPLLMNLLMQSLMQADPRLRSPDNMSYEELLRAFGDGTENMGADEEVISNLPTATLTDPQQEIPQDQVQCCICLENFEAGQERKTLPCLHGFHTECVDKWLRSNGSCPICKHKLSS